MVLSGEPAAALRLIHEVMGMMEAVGHHQYEPEFNRIKGIALREQNDIAGSQAAFTEALGSARRRQMKVYELRAATDLARLWGEQSRREEARELLAPLYGWFTRASTPPTSKKRRHCSTNSLEPASIRFRSLRQRAQRESGAPSRRAVSRHNPPAPRYKCGPCNCAKRSDRSRTGRGR